MFRQYIFIINTNFLEIMRKIVKFIETCFGANEHKVDLLIIP